MSRKKSGSSSRVKKRRSAPLIGNGPVVPGGCGFVVALTHKQTNQQQYVKIKGKNLGITESVNTATRFPDMTEASICVALITQQTKNLIASYKEVHVCGKLDHEPDGAVIDDRAPEFFDELLKNSGAIL